MGQIRGKKAKVSACNIRSLSSFGIPYAGMHILVSTDNSAMEDGQGDFDAYVVGDGVTAATALPLQPIEKIAQQLKNIISGVVSNEYTVSGYSAQYFGSYNFKAGTEYTFLIETSAAATLYFMICDAEHNTIRANDGYSSFPKTIKWTPAQDYDGACLNLRNGGTNTYKITVTGGGLLTRLEDVDIIKEKVSQLGQEINGNHESEDTNPGIASSYWKNNEGSIGYAASGMGLHRVDFISVKEGEELELTTTLGEAGVDAAYFCNNSGTIIQTIAKSAVPFSGNVPVGATRMYINYLSTYTLSSNGMADKVEKNEEEIAYLQKETKTLEYTAKEEIGIIYPVEFTNTTRYWKGNVGETISESAASALKRTTTFWDVEEGEQYYIKNGGGSGLSNNAAYIITDSNNVILAREDGEKLNYTLVTIPTGGTRIYFNANKDHISDFSFRLFGNLEEVIEEVDELVHINDFVNVEDLSDSPQYAGASRWEDNGNGYVQQGISGSLYRFEPISVPEGVKVYLKFTKISGIFYNVCFFTNDSGRILGILDNSYELVTPPTGTTKMYINNGAPAANKVQIFFASGMLINEDGGEETDSISIYAPSPQLPANSSTDSDFNCETVTSQDFHDAFESLIEETPVFFINGLITPRNGNVFEKVGTDASGQLSIKSYVFSRRNRYAWKAADRLYSYKNGSTIVYIDSCSPLVGSTIYSNSNRTLLGATISSYNGSTNSFEASNGNTYTRDASNDVSAKVVYSMSPMNVEGSSNLPIYTKTGSSIGTSTAVDTTHISYNSVTYERCESLDYHTDQKGTIVLWGNEHGPQSDPCEPSVILYRIAKDLTEGCRNNPFLQYLWKYFKFVFIPAANPYGVNNKTRNNYNNVNLNRNYNTPGWYSVTDTDKGTYPGDQPETQYIMNTVKFFDASIAIDIHCLGYISPYPSGGYYPAGRTHFEGVIPGGSNGEYNLRVLNTMGELSCNYTSYGNGDYETGSQGADWLNYEEIAGGLIEMTPGEGAASYNGKQHTAKIMFIDYTLLLNTLRVWLSGFDPNTNLKKIGIW